MYSLSIIRTYLHSEKTYVTRSLASRTIWPSSNRQNSKNKAKKRKQIAYRRRQYRRQGDRSDSPCLLFYYTVILNLLNVFPFVAYEREETIRRTNGFIGLRSFLSLIQQKANNLCAIVRGTTNDSVVGQDRSFRYPPRCWIPSYVARVVVGGLKMDANEHPSF